jgi:hypothetical protein
MSSAARSSRVGPSQLAGYVNRTKQSATRPVVPRCLGIGSAETYFITLGLDGYARAKGSPYLHRGEGGREAARNCAHPSRSVMQFQCFDAGRDSTFRQTADTSPARPPSDDTRCPSEQDCVPTPSPPLLVSDRNLLRLWRIRRARAILTPL